MRVAAIAIVLLAAGLTGCLQQGDQLSPTERDGPAANASTASGADPNGSRAEAAETDQGAGNATEDDATDAGGSDDQPDPDTLPGNLSMADADVLERTDERAAFVWNGTLEAEPDAASMAERAVFDVPAGIPLRVNATLAWQAVSDLDLAVDGDGVDAFCASSTGQAATDEGGTEACEVRTLERSSWDTWGLTVLASEGDGGAATGSISFTATLTVEIAEPWSGPPVEAPAPGPPVSFGPGWPSISDAEVRPGARVVNPSGGTGTANFVFASPDNRTLYLGWIAHGVDGLLPGDELEIASGAATGTLVYCSWGVATETVTCPDLGSNHAGYQGDFALIRLPTGARPLVHPAVPVWGGPTELGDAPQTGDLARWYGNTPLRDGHQEDVGPLDAQVGRVWTADEQRSWTLSGGLPGDSGSPVIHEDGSALGVVSTLRATTDADRPVANGVTNLATAIATMEATTAIDVELTTWPMFETPRVEDLLPGPAPSEPSR